MLSAADQIDRIADAIQRHGATMLPGARLDAAEDDLSAYAEFGVEYPTGHRLHVTLTVDVTYGYPSWSIYAFQFQDRDEQTIFRFDNWNHHPEIETFPHHKHVGPDETVEPHPLPSLGTILREVERFVDA